MGHRSHPTPRRYRPLPGPAHPRRPHGRRPRRDARPGRRAGARSGRGAGGRTAAGGEPRLPGTDHVVRRAGLLRRRLRPRRPRRPHPRPVPPPRRARHGAVRQHPDRHPWPGRAGAPYPGGAGAAAAGLHGPGRLRGAAAPADERQRQARRARPAGRRTRRHPVRRSRPAHSRRGGAVPALRRGAGPAPHRGGGQLLRPGRTLAARHPADQPCPHRTRRRAGHP